MIAVEKEKQVCHGFKHTQSSLSWALHPLQCKRHVCGKQQGIIFTFLLSYWKNPKKQQQQQQKAPKQTNKKTKNHPKHRAGSVWMLIYIQWDFHLLVLCRQSPEQMLKSSLQKVTCASTFQLWDASFPVQAFRITVRVRTFSEGGRERGSDLFIQVSVKLPLTCDTMQGLLALPAG